MCGRFASSVPSEELARLFRVDAVEEDLPPPSWNVSPTRIARVVAVVDGTRELAGFRWGLIPRWADDPSIGSRMINARAETLERRPAFREAFRRRRCLVPVDGFYEWAGRRPDGRRQPWFVAPRDRGVLALAGLWEQWKGAEGTRSFTIVTGPPTEEVKRIHDRMPVAIPPQMWDAWLDPAIDDPADVRRLLEDAQGEPPPVVLRPVDTRVNDPRNDGPELLDEPSEVNVLGVDQP